MGIFDSFGKKDSGSNGHHIEKILSEFDLMKISGEQPSIGNIHSFCQIIALTNNNSTVMDMIFALQNENDINGPMVKTLLYAFGVSLYQLSIAREISADNIKTAMKLLEWAIKIDNGYYQAYNRLGDCWMRIENGFNDAISCFKSSLQLTGKGTPSLEMFSGSYSDAFTGDNYLKIGLCLLKLNRKDDAEIFIKEAKKIVSDDYQGFIEIGFRNWDDIFDLLENYNYEEDQSNKEKEKQNKEKILGQISQAVDLKRNGEFKSANKIYTNLNNEYPENPIILKSWAKTLVCMGQYDDAIEKYQLAVKHFDAQDNDGESLQCNDQIMGIKNRLNNPEQFKNWVRAVSGGSVSDPIL